MTSAHLGALGSMFQDTPAACRLSDMKVVCFVAALCVGAAFWGVAIAGFIGMRP